MVSVFLFLLVELILAEQDFVSVPTSIGVVQGKTVNYGNDRNQLYYGKADVFLGIPYAEAPVGNLRFRAPRNAPASSSVHDATYFRPKCPQTNAGTPVNEDCLYLNVYTQQSGNSSASMAVMVFIDGDDGLTTGGADKSQLKGTVRNLVSRGVVVVTFQYRLGALGFFSTQAAGFESNIGMLDQVKALEWVQRDISNFGGNPKRITLCGQGGGACAVSAHTLSPLSQNLFQQAIIQSGTIDTCYSSDGSTSDVVQPSLTTQPPMLQYDQGVPYSPLDLGSNYNQGGASSQSANGQGNAYSQSGSSQQLQNTNQGLPTLNYNPGAPNGNQGQLAQNGQTTNYNQATNYNQGSQTYLPQYYNDGEPHEQNPVLSQGSNYNSNMNRNSNYYQGTGYNSANAQYDQSLGNPSQELAQQLCNVTSEQWRRGDVGDLRGCLSNYSVDFIVQTQQNRVATWMIVRDNYFLPDTIQNLAARRPPIPIIIGTVQDEDADYAFKLVANGDATTQSEDEMFNNWMVDFARKNRVNQSTASQIGNIISQNYNISNSPQTSPTSSMMFDQPTQYGNQNQGAMMGNSGNAQHSGNNGYSTQNQNVNTNGNSGAISATGNGNSVPFTDKAGHANEGQTQYDAGGTITDAQTIQSLRTMSSVTADSGIMSQTATQIDTFIRNGNQFVRVYQFSYVSDLARQNVPNLGSWKPVYKGQDQVFLFMSETIWSEGRATSQDRAVADQMGEKWTQFAKEGQVSNWQPSDTHNYPYCNLNTQSNVLTGYAQSARTVFNDQINPIVQQAQQQSIPQYSPAPRSNQNPARGQYSTDGQSSTFQISFNLNDYPLPLLRPNNNGCC